jgi:hypothetical protein
LPFEIEENEEFIDCRDDLPIYETRQDPLDLNWLYRTRTIVKYSPEPTEKNFDTPCTDSTGEKDTDTAQKDMYAHLTHVPTNQATQMLVAEDWMFAFAAKNPFESRAPVIFDTGASLAITPNQHNFVEPLTSLSRPTTLGGMANDLEIKGIGMVAWTFDAADRSEIQLLTQAYWVTNSKARLLSPQKLFNMKRGIFGQYQGDEESFRLILNDNPPIDITYDIRSSIQIGYARTGPDLNPQVNTVLSTENQNMSDSQKLLLDWHNIFAHLNFARVQQVLRDIPFIANKFGNATKCEPPMCHTCELAKSKRRAKKSSLQTKTTERDGALKTVNVKVGARVSLDHFESILLGRTYDSYDKPSSTKFKGGAIYVEHDSVLVHCEHQVGFSSG